MATEPAPPVDAGDGSGGPADLRLVGGLPAWAGSIRFRLAALYSLVLFGVAVAVVAVAYVAVAQGVSGEPVSQVTDVAAVLDPTRPLIDPDAGLDGEEPADPFAPEPEPDTVAESAARADLAAFERAVNDRTLGELRTYGLGALLVFLVTSLCVGVLVAAWVLRPIQRITEAAQDIQATDLSRRIALGGADDELRHLADTFDDLLARIDDAFDAQRRLIHEVSHELRNPLATIRTNLEVALADPDVDIDELRRTAAVVDRSADRMSRLVDDLLATARNEVPALDSEPVDLTLLAAEIADEFAGPAEARTLSIDASGVGSAPRWVIGDRVALKRCLANLVANAVRLAPEGTTIRVATGAAPGWVWATVEDEGPGISPDDQERVFQRFWRNNPRDRDRGHSGLGLTIVQRIVEAHGGEVHLVSSLGTGSTFSVRLPASAGGAAAPVPGGADGLSGPSQR